MYTYTEVRRPQTKNNTLEHRLIDKGFIPSSLIHPEDGVNRVTIDGWFSCSEEYLDQLAEKMASLCIDCEHEAHISYCINRMSVDNDPPVDLICQTEKLWMSDYKQSGFYISIEFGVRYWEACPPECIL